MTNVTSESVRRVQHTLADAGSTSKVVGLVQTARTAQEAATALGVDVGAIAKSLVFAIDDQAVMALVAGDRQCDMASLSEVLGLAAKPKRADPDLVRNATGFAIGGVSPVGHVTKLPIAIDASLRRFPALYAAAGHPHYVFATSYDELLALTGAVEMPDAQSGS